MERARFHTLSVESRRCRLSQFGQKRSFGHWTEISREETFPGERTLTESSAAPTTHQNVPQAARKQVQ